jgi:hypothetical protein
MTSFPAEKYPLKPSVAEIRVLNSENNTHYYMNLYVPTVKEFFKFLLANRKNVYQTNGMPGVAGPATLALERIFANVPTKFPLMDLIRFLRQEQKHFCGEFMFSPTYPNPTITYEELEDALVRWYVHTGQMRQAAIDETPEVPYP